MPDNTNGSLSTDEKGKAVMGRDPKQNAGGDSPLTTGRRIGVKADDAGDNEVVSTSADQSGHIPTGGAEH